MGAPEMEDAASGGEAIVLNAYFGDSAWTFNRG
jgi:hypothetical protein